MLFLCLDRFDPGFFSCWCTFPWLLSFKPVPGPYTRLYEYVSGCYYSIEKPGTRFKHVYSPIQRFYTKPLQSIGRRKTAAYLGLFGAYIMPIWYTWHPGRISSDFPYYVNHICFPTGFRVISVTPGTAAIGIPIVVS